MAAEKTIYEVLERDHRTVSDLIERIQGTTDATEREDLFTTMMQELVAHAEAEQETFYATLGERDETRALVQEAETEHDRIVELLDELDTMEAGAEGFDATLRELQQAVEHHVQEEEREIFEQARSVLSDEEAHDIANRFREEKQSRLG